jgi:glycerophosphoryl diester phosphodiesterase
VGWDHAGLTAAAIRGVHERGCKCWAWTADEPSRMRELAAWGVDGIITNHPDRLASVRAEIG